MNGAAHDHCHHLLFVVVADLVGGRVLTGFSCQPVSIYLLVKSRSETSV